MTLEQAQANPLIKALGSDKIYEKLKEMSDEEIQSAQALVMSRGAELITHERANRVVDILMYELNRRENRRQLEITRKENQQSFNVMRTLTFIAIGLSVVQALIGILALRR